MIKFVKKRPEMSDLLKETISIIQSDETEKKADSKHNPYLRARELWNDAYGGVELKLYNQQRTNMFLAGAIIVLTIGIAYIGSQSKIVPVVAELYNGSVVSVLDTQNAPTLTDKIVDNQLEQFVISLRSISADNTVQSRWENVAQGMSIGQASTYVQNYYQQNDPSVLSRQYLVNVQINYIVHNSPHVDQISWTENRQGLDGSNQGQTTYTALVTYQFDQNAVTQELSKYNPFGVFISNLSVAQNN